LSSSLGPGSVFLDVGAHIGYFSIKASAQVGPTGRVVAFEPNPETLKLLRENVKVNRTFNILIQPVACTDRERTLNLYAAPIVNTGASSLSQQNASVSASDLPRPYTVRGRAIDDVIRELNLSRVDAVKIDVEGAEVSVLRGALTTLKQFHPKVVVEVIASQLASFQTTPEEVAALLRGAGYNMGKPLNPEAADWEWTVQDPQALKSGIQMADPSASGQLTRGFHVLEQNAWRWTDGRFSVTLRTPTGANEKGARLVLNFHVPEVSLKELNSMTLSIKVGDQIVRPETLSTPGKHELAREVPASALRNPLTEVEFSLDKFLNRNGGENGIIVTSVGLESK
jgi:FkbM family methyltransferase